LKLGEFTLILSLSKMVSFKIRFNFDGMVKFGKILGYFFFVKIFEQILILLNQDKSKQGYNCNVKIPKWVRTGILKISSEL